MWPNQFREFLNEYPLTSTQKCILYTLYSYSDGNGNSWPSLTTLMKDCSLTRSNLIININKLIEIGIITKTKISQKNGHVSSNIYTINHPLPSIVAILPLKL